MKKQNETSEYTLQFDDEMTDGAASASSPTSMLVARPASGLYKWSAPVGPAPPGPTVPFPFPRADLRLDVDGSYSQNTASGTLYSLTAPVFHWVASLHATGPNIWAGQIWYKDGTAAAFQYTQVKINVTRNAAGLPVSAAVTFSAAGTAPLTRVFSYNSRYFRKVEFEFDSAQNTTAILDIDTHAHPNRPATLPKEKLTIQKVYRRAGFDVSTSSSASSVVPLGGTGADGVWSDQEMHDAMQTYWSRFSNKARWALWTFFAARHEMGPGLGGIMFDDIGPNHRQGTALFLNSFISRAPTGDPAPAAWVRRMSFWTAVHEMGHAFNLAHAWQKAMGTQWIPLTNEPESRSFMNYPYSVLGGAPAFFADFEFRFSDQELLFMRHAPERFVQMGNADWFDNHGFQQDRVLAEPRFRLDLIPPGKGASFEFLEPVVLDLQLTNISDGPQLIEEKLLADTDHLTVIIKREGCPARQYTPFARKCWERKDVALQPGRSIRDSLFISAGRNGWDIAEPGLYSIQVAVHLEEEDVLSEPLMLRVGRPPSYEEEKIASDYFTEEVGRVLAFDGTHVLTDGRDTLRELADKFRQSRASIHARIALGSPLARRSRTLEMGETRTTELQSAADLGGSIRSTSADERQAREDLGILVKEARRADQTLGRVDYIYYVNRFKDLLNIKSAIRDQDATDALPDAVAALLKQGSTGAKAKPVSIGTKPKPVRVGKNLKVVSTDKNQKSASKQDVPA